MCSSLRVTSFPFTDIRSHGSSVFGNQPATQWSWTVVLWRELLSTDNLFPFISDNDGKSEKKGGKKADKGKPDKPSTAKSKSDKKVTPPHLRFIHVTALHHNGSGKVVVQKVLVFDFFNRLNLFFINLILISIIF